MTDLKIFLAAQEKFQEKLGNNIESQEFINNMILALQVELVELLNTTMWKPWRKYSNEDKQKYYKERYLQELADCYIFLFNLSLAKGFTFEEIDEQIHKKININLLRQENGY
jgi:dimeric dUTPase (all-alpha-NTP-PPase superfamily)